MAEIKVQKGDSIWKIAKRVKPAGVSTDAFVKQMIAANPELADPDKIKPGMVLQAPGAKEPPTPRMDPRAKPGERGHQAPMRRGRGYEAPFTARGMAVPPAPADLQRGAEPTVNEVMVGRDGEISARVGTEQFGPAGSALDRQAAMVEIARRQELTRRAAVQQEQTLEANLRGRGFTNVTSTVADPTEGTVDPDLQPGPLEGGALLQRNPKTNYPREAAIPLPKPKDIYLAQAMNFASAGDRGNYTLGDPAGLLEEGTVNLADRPRVPNPDGTFSSIRSKSFAIDGKEVVVPTMAPDGSQLSDDKAVSQFLDSGEHLGVFASPESATAYAKRLSLGLGGPTHDPDAFIDMGSPRWREVFLEGNLAAQEANRNRRKAVVPGAPPVKAKVRVPVAPTEQSLDRLGGFMATAGGRTMGGKNAPK